MAGNHHGRQDVADPKDYAYDQDKGSMRIEGREHCISHYGHKDESLLGL
jgi:hypothetical protein